MMDNVGVVVIGRNEGERLLACLRSIKPAGLPVFYADSASTDGSPDRAAAEGAQVLRLDAVTPLNAARGRKEGMAALLEAHPQIDFIQFIDGDCLLQPHFIATALAFLEAKPRTAAVCGRRFEAHPEASFYNRLCDEEWNTPPGKADAFGGDALVRVAALQQVGGYDASLMASEEPELSARMRAAGWEIWRIDEPMTQHDAAIFTFKAYWRRHLRGGVGYLQAWRRTANLPQRINGRTLVSALLWVVVLPLLIIIAALAFGRPSILLAMPLLYLLQVARMAARKGLTSWYNWRAAAAVLSIKSAELLGAISALMAGSARSAIEYKAR